MCRPLFILARYYRTNLKLLIASPASDSKINFVWHCDRFCFCRKLCQTEMMIVSAFSIFYDRKTRAFATRIFVCRAAIHYQSDFNFDTALNTVLPFYTNTAFMPTLHINAAHISISQAYHYIAIYYQSDHSIPLLYKTLILRNIIPISVSRHTDNTRALHPCHNTACFFDTARLAVQLNRIIQNHSTCHYVATTHCIFHKSLSITLVAAMVFSKTIAHNSYRLIL